MIKEITAKEELRDKLKTAFDRFEISLNGQKNLPLHDLRQKSFLDFFNTGFPTIRNEEWKYTSLEPFLKYDYKVSTISGNGHPTLQGIDLKKFLIEGLNCHKVVLVNGQFNSELSDIRKDDTGLEISNLSDLINKNEKQVEKYFNSLTKQSKESIVKLNTSFALIGLFIHIKKNAALKYPLHIINIIDRRVEKSIVFYRNIIVAETNSEAKILHTQHSIGGNAVMVNAVEEIFAENNSRLDYIKLQDIHTETNKWNEPISLIDNVFIQNTTNALVNAYTISLSGDFIRNNLSVLLPEKNSETHLYGLYLPKGNDLIDNHTFVDHAVSNCFSNELYKGIMTDKSKAVFNGKILVRKDAQKTNAFQSNKNILLTRDAVVNTKPQLEIFADDVKCSHGATTGQLDEKALFYLEARGIGGEKAKQMLTLAFAEEVVEKIKNEYIHEHIDRIISRQIGFDF